eukprot:TRINITY_DN8006_c0_g1_i2.p1 TRINITY_DN8006_c0_g1~~TRINITY_DN8006_c0_g1_i2.p1  ORF type:complete len:238 (-),score=34.24 TRINITY_DN8006_c0_g1_i2:84-797(-)
MAAAGGASKPTATVRPKFLPSKSKSRPQSPSPRADSKKAPQDSTMSSVLKDLRSAFSLEDKTQKKDESKSTGAVQAGEEVGSRMMIGTGDKQRPYRLDIDEPETMDNLLRIVREVRQTSVNAKAKEIDLNQKKRAHDLEMKRLHKLRKNMRPENNSLAPQDPTRHREICDFRRRAQRSQGIEKLSYVNPELRRTFLVRHEKSLLASMDAEVIAANRARQRPHTTPTMRQPMSAREMR